MEKFRVPPPTPIYFFFGEGGVSEIFFVCPTGHKSKLNKWKGRFQSLEKKVKIAYSVDMAIF